MRRSSAYVTVRTLPGKTAEWLSAIRGRVRLRPHLVLEPRRCGLVVVDVQRYFAHPEGRSYLPAAGTMVPGLVRLLAAWRAVGGQVIFTRHCHEGDHDLGMLGRFYTDHIRCDEPDSELMPELEPRAGEPVLRKKTYDAFLGTGLEDLLRDKKLDQVLVTGVLTHLCCETSARSAFVRGFEVYVAADGCASSEERLHVGALSGLADGVAVLMSIDEVAARCRM